MTINQFIKNLPHANLLNKLERDQLVWCLAFNFMTDEYGISLIAYMPRVAGRLGKLLATAR